MLVDPATLGLNLHIIIGAVLCLSVAIVLLIAIATGVNYLLWKRRRDAAEAAERRRRIGPDGRMLPPASRGLCQACARASDAVHHLPDGRRLCRVCLDAAVSAGVGSSRDAR